MTVGDTVEKIHAAAAAVRPGVLRLPTWLEGRTGALSEMILPARDDGVARASAEPLLLPDGTIASDGLARAMRGIRAMADEGLGGTWWGKAYRPPETSGFDALVLAVPGDTRGNMIG